MNGVLDAEPDPQAAFNLVLCTFALGDKEMMKQAFSKLVEVFYSSFLHVVEVHHKPFARNTSNLQPTCHALPEAAVPILALSFTSSVADQCPLSALSLMQHTRIASESRVQNASIAADIIA